MCGSEVDTVMKTLVPRDTQRLDDIKKRIEKVTGTEFETTEQAVTAILQYLDKATPAVQAMEWVRKALG